MSERVTMPALGESVTEGTVTRWLKSVGDRVEVDEPLLEVSTDKVDTEIPSPVAGVLEQILVEEDETVEVGADLAVIGDGSGAGGADDSSAGQEQAAEPEPQQAAEPEPEPEPEQAPAQSGSGGSSGGGEVSGGETVTMPALGESVTEGTVTRWLKQEGDEVAVDEPLLEVSTDKVDTEIPSPVAGTLTKILAQEDETVEVGGALAIIGGSVDSAAPSGAPESAEEAEEEAAERSEPSTEQAEPEQAAAPSEEPQEAEPEQAPAQEQAEPEAGSSEAEAAEDAQGDADETSTQVATSPEPSSQDRGADAAAYVTPLVRKLAADHGIDLSSIEGTGIGGRIRKQDVLAAAEARTAEAAKAEAPKAEPAPAAQAPARTATAAPSAAAAKRGTTEKMSRLRQTIARRMVESLEVSAQLTTVVEVDVSRIARLRERAKEEFLKREGTKLSFLPFFAQAAVEALKAHPNVNASINGDEVTYHAAEHLGIAVDTVRGLLVPVIKDAGDLNIAGLARKIADLAARTRDSKITPDELSGGTFTITNTGSRGALFDTPIINQPQVAILGTGAVVKRPVVVEDDAGGSTIAIRPMCYLALTYDHRIVDGADAARFLTTMKARLEEGAFEADLGL
ncbi:MAG: 2-oxoglutarate dehydrogenase, E2 component, dihydrolipoamide succinyltransferase [Actinomycetales bacterium]|nr:2-oxoglutarate dehydrogenase, E2 component, dihydrolipoamide succinyltransferase [Actinomycetales bacterium]